MQYLKITSFICLFISSAVSVPIPVPEAKPIFLLGAAGSIPTIVLMNGLATTTALTGVGYLGLAGAAAASLTGQEEETGYETVETGYHGQRSRSSPTFLSRFSRNQVQ